MGPPSSHHHHHHQYQPHHHRSTDQPHHGRNSNSTAPRFNRNGRPLEPAGSVALVPALVFVNHHLVPPGYSPLRFVWSDLGLVSLVYDSRFVLLTHVYCPFAQPPPQQPEPAEAGSDGSRPVRSNADMPD